MIKLEVLYLQQGRTARLRNDFLVPFHRAGRDQIMQDHWFTPAGEGSKKGKADNERAGLLSTGARGPSGMRNLCSADKKTSLSH